MDAGYGGNGRDGLLPAVVWLGSGFLAVQYHTVDLAGLGFGRSDDSQLGIGWGRRHAGILLHCQFNRHWAGPEFRAGRIQYRRAHSNGPHRRRPAIPTGRFWPSCRSRSRRRDGPRYCQRWPYSCRNGTNALFRGAGLCRCGRYDEPGAERLRARQGLCDGGLCQPFDQSSHR